MKKLIAFAFATALAASGSALAQTQGQPGQAPPPEHLSGRVVEIQPDQSSAVIETEDGQRIPFRGNPETLKDLKVGDEVELNLRQPAAPPQK